MSLREALCHSAEHCFTPRNTTSLREPEFHLWNRQNASAITQHCLQNNQDTTQSSREMSIDTMSLREVLFPLRETFLQLRDNYVTPRNISKYPETVPTVLDTPEPS